MTTPLTRRETLSAAAAATAAALAGCNSPDDGEATPTDTTTTEPTTTTAAGGEGLSVSGSWPAFQFDAARTGYGQGVPGPGPAAERAYERSLAGAAVPPVVYAGTVFAAGGSTLAAYDAETGEQAWTYDLDAPATGTLSVSPLAGAVFATAGESVHAVSTDGERQWSQSLGSPVAGPVVGDSQVFAATDDGTVAALGVGSGSETWSVSLDAGPTGPMALGPIGLAVTTVDGALSVRSSKDGSEVFTADLNAPAVDYPVLAGTRAFVTSREGTLYAFESDGSVAWRTQAEGAARCPPAVTENHAFVVGDDGLLSFRRQDGDRLYQEDTLTGVDVSIAEDALYIAQSDGLTVRRATDAGQLWSVSFDDAPTAPAVVDGAAFLGVGDALVALGATR